MIIRLTSKLFTEDPDSRFADTLGVPRGFWNELWKRHMMLNYTPNELREYFRLKTGKEINRMQIPRWIFRTKIYNKAQPFVKKGALVASTEIFGDLEEDLIRELTKQYKNSVNIKHRIII